MMRTFNTNSSIQSEEHWQVFTCDFFVISVYVMNYLLGLPLNSYIITLLLNKRRSLDPRDVFTLNQAAAEIFFMIFTHFHILLIVRPGTWINQPVGFFLGTGILVRGLLQCCVCLERYMAVIHPITFLKFRPLRYRVVACVVVWMCGLASGVICMFTFPNIPFKPFGVVCFIILSISVFTCVSVLKKLKYPGPGERNSDRGMEDGAKKRALQVIRMNMLTFLVQSTPLAVLFSILNRLPEIAFSMALNVCLAINLIMSYVQPVFVLYKAGKLW